MTTLKKHAPLCLWRKLTRNGLLNFAREQHDVSAKAPARASVGTWHSQVAHCIPCPLHSLPVSQNLIFILQKGHSARFLLKDRTSIVSPLQVWKSSVETGRHNATRQLQLSLSPPWISTNLILFACSFLITI